MPDTNEPKEINSLLLEATTSELIQIFHHLQEQRVGTYIRFAKVFQDFLNDKDIDMFQKHCTSITKSFSMTSSDIRDLESVFRKQNKIIIADIINDIQDLEKEKLKQTSKFQVLKTEQSSASEEDADKEIETTVKDLNKIVENINQKLEDLLMETEGED